MFVMHSYMPWHSAQELDAQQNQLPELPAALGGLAQLRELLLDDNRRDDQVLFICAQLTRQVVDLSHPPSCHWWGFAQETGGPGYNQYYSTALNALCV